MKPVEYAQIWAKNPMAALIKLEEEVNLLVEHGYVPAGPAAVITGKAVFPSQYSTAENPMTEIEEGWFAYQTLVFMPRVSKPVLVPAGAMK